MLVLCKIGCFGYKKVEIHGMYVGEKSLISLDDLAQAHRFVQGEFWVEMANWVEIF